MRSMHNTNEYIIDHSVLKAQYKITNTTCLSDFSTIIKGNIFYVITEAGRPFPSVIIKPVITSQRFKTTTTLEQTNQINVLFVQSYRERAMTNVTYIIIRNV